MCQYIWTIKENSKAIPNFMFLRSEFFSSKKCVQFASQVNKNIHLSDKIYCIYTRILCTYFALNKLLLTELTYVIVCNKYPSFNNEVSSSKYISILSHKYFINDHYRNRKH